jgi:hypothetical protein
MKMIATIIYYTVIALIAVVIVVMVLSFAAVILWSLIFHPVSTIAFCFLVFITPLFQWACRRKDQP